ncbi:MAG: hypothetical protein JJT93_10855, partial [Gammaproteobacteria bacterium]|nr:hypothetical protein [Gammaproteobacteria bacterium]
MSEQPAPSAPPPHLGPITCVTVTSEDPAGLAALYSEWLGYREVPAGVAPLPAALADGWGAPAQTGAETRLLAPAKGTGFWFRFVAGQTGDYRALTTWGWNASELIVQDVDALAAHLENSPFRIIGPPEDLSFTDAIRAMQIEGPAGEVVYLTQFKRRLEEFDTPEPECAVDRCFIVILGGADLHALKRFYETRFGVPDAPVMPVKISVLSNALGLPAEQAHDLAALPLAGQSFIEADQYPAEAIARRTPEGALPPAMAIVSFRVPDLAPHQAAALGPVYTSDLPPYAGARALTLRGPAGELIELIEAPR